MLASELGCPKMTLETRVFPTLTAPNLTQTRWSTKCKVEIEQLISFFPPLSYGNAWKSTSSRSWVQSVAKGFEQLGWLGEVPAAERKSLQG